MSLHEECGVFGIYSNNESLDIVHETYLALYALQHRGQISCGIAVRNGSEVTSRTGLGTVPEVFTNDELAYLSSKGNGKVAIGHVRYSARELSDEINSQPLVMRYARGVVSIANNGSLVNTAELRQELEQGGAIFQTGCNAELLVYLIARFRLQTECIEDAISLAMDKLSGAYSFVLMSPKKLVAVRDPNGFRPLCIGKLGESYVVASESCALQSLGAEFLRDVEPGEIIVIDKNGMRSVTAHCGKKSTMCIFEHVYFARPDSVLDGASVHEARRRAGAFLAKEYPVEADVVIGVPDSGIDAAIGYAKESGIPYGMGFIKNRYIGRTFIQDSQIQREHSVRIKLNPLGNEVEGKRVVLVDDSIVRGTTCANIVSQLRHAGATEVHMRISSPPFIHPCYFGTDISSTEFLIACRMELADIVKEVGADSLGYLSLDALHQIAKGSKVGFCDACFTGKYPVKIPDVIDVDKYNTKLKSRIK